MLNMGFSVKIPFEKKQIHSLKKHLKNNQKKKALLFNRPFDKAILFPVVLYRKKLKPPH